MPSVQRTLSRAELADELDVHSETIGRYDREGAPHERRGRANVYNAPEYRAWMKANGKTGKEGRPSFAESSPDLEAARLRKENALAAKYELQVERERGELLAAAEVKQFGVRMLTTFRNKLRGLPATLSPQLEGRDGAQREVILARCLDESLNDLADSLEKLCSSAATA